MKNKNLLLLNLFIFLVNILNLIHLYTKTIYLNNYKLNNKFICY